MHGHILASVVICELILRFHHRLIGSITDLKKYRLGSIRFLTCQNQYYAKIRSMEPLIVIKSSVYLLAPLIYQCGTYCAWSALNRLALLMGENDQADLHLNIYLNKFI